MNNMDITICGGTEAAIHRISLGAFAPARALATAFNDHPHEASRPFDQQRAVLAPSPSWSVTEPARMPIT